MGVPPHKLIKETTSMAVYKRLFDCVINGQFQPGEWIRERQLKEMLGVSSTPIREALRMLVQEQILESVPHQGVRVKHFSMKEIEDYYELRAEMEGLAAGLAAGRATPQLTARLEEVLHQQRKFLDQACSPAEAMESNNEFHDLIVEAGGNEMLKNTLLHLRVGINWIQHMAWKLNNDRHFITYHQHRAILEAIVIGDANKARSRMQEHVWDSIKLISQRQ